MSISILNTDAGLSGKTVLTAEGTHTITGALTFDRDPSAPFIVSASSAVVTNLDADLLDGKHSTSFMLLDGTQVMTGKLGLGVIGQVQFPATQNGSADANCLDDYEELTWTPGISSSGGGTPTYTTASGFYTKIGRLVVASGRVTLATKGTLAAGNVLLSGLPISAGDPGVNSIGTLHIGYWGNMSTTVVMLNGFVIPGSTTAGIYHATAATATLTPTQVSDINTTLDLIFSAIYISAV